MKNTIVEKIIFLDFDGVITTRESNFKLAPEKLELLGKIINATGCSLVISSSVRRNNLKNTIEYFLSDIFKRSNNGIVFPFCDKIVGVTDMYYPKFYSINCIIRSDNFARQRGDEIAEWIEKNNFTGRYVILDDMNDMLDNQKNYLVQTDSSTGLSEPDVEKAIRILNN